MLALVFGSVILKVNVCYSRKTLGRPFVTGGMQSVSYFVSNSFCPLNLKLKSVMGTFPIVFALKNS
jgi:hypothetical protein